MFGGSRRNDDNGGAPVVLIITLVSVVVYALSASCSPARCPATASWPPTGPARCSPGSRPRWPRALTKISGEMGRIPTKDLRAGRAVQRVLLRPRRRSRASASPRCSRPTRRWRSGSTSSAGSPAQLGRPRVSRGVKWLDALLGRSKPAQARPGQPVRAADGRRHPGGRDRAAARPGSARSASARPRAARSPTMQGDVQRAAGRRRRAEGRGEHRRLRLHLAARPARPRRARRPGHRPARGQLHAGGQRASARRCCARWSASPTRTAAGSAWSTSTSGARSTRSRRRGARAARQRARAAGARRGRRRPAGRARPRAAGSPSGARPASEPRCDASSDLGAEPHDGAVRVGHPDLAQPPRPDLGTPDRAGAVGGQPERGPLGVHGASRPARRRSTRPGRRPGRRRGRCAKCSSAPSRTAMRYGVLSGDASTTRKPERLPERRGHRRVRARQDRHRPPVVVTHAAIIPDPQRAAGTRTGRCGRMPG